MRRILIIVVLFLLYSPSFGQDKLVNCSIHFYKNGNNNIFPDTWYSGKISAYVTAMDTSEYKRSTEVLYNAFDKYPYEVLNDNLEQVHFFDTLQFYGMNFGGTYFGKTVCLTNHGIQFNYTNDYIEKVFHAEFSSILLNRYASESYSSRWESINDSTYKYLGSGVDALKAGSADEKFEEKINRNGFLTEYAMSSMENDFNAIAKNIFMNEEGFWETVHQYDKIEQKVNLFIELYHEINPIFNLEYFEDL